MKTYLDGLTGDADVLLADLYTVTLLDGTVYRWTSWERDLTTGGHTYLSPSGGAPGIERGQFAQAETLSIDTLDLTFYGAGFTVGGKALVEQARTGFFYGARVQVDHLVMPTPGDVSLGSIPSMFEGRVAGGDVDGVNLTLRLKSELVALNVLIPKRVVRPTCNWAVYDANCGLSRGGFTLTGTASGTPTKTTLSSTTGGIIAKADDYFDLGVLKMTSGAQSGSWRDVIKFKVVTGTATFTLKTPFKAAPVAGDTFSVYPGCDRSREMCDSIANGGKFNNLAQFGAFPHVPPSSEAGS